MKRPFQVGDHVRDKSTGATGRVIRIFIYRELYKHLAVIKFDSPHPLYGAATTAWDDEVDLIQEAAEGRAR